MIKKERSDLKLVNWVNDNCPPIDLNLQAIEIVKLVSAYNDLKKQNKQLSVEFITRNGKKYVDYTESDLRFTGWENECIIIDRCENHYLVPVERYAELKEIDVKTLLDEAGWDIDFVFAVDVLLAEKPKQMSISKAIEELLELSTKLMQYYNDNKKIFVEDIKEEVVDVSMHIFLLRKLFGVTYADTRLKVDKFLNSADYQNYLTKYAGKKSLNSTK